MCTVSVSLQRNGRDQKDTLDIAKRRARYRVDCIAGGRLPAENDSTRSTGSAVTRKSGSPGQLKDEVGSRRQKRSEASVTPLVQLPQLHISGKRLSTESSVG